MNFKYQWIILVSVAGGCKTVMFHIAYMRGLVAAMTPT